MKKKISTLFSLGLLCLILSSTYGSAAKTYLGVKKGDTFEYSYSYQDNTTSLKADIKMTIDYISEGTESATVNYSFVIDSENTNLMEENGNVVEVKLDFEEEEEKEEEIINISETPFF
jgi:hypothetical protein